MQQRLIFIGPTATGHQPTSGGTMKNRLFLQRFSSLFEKIVVVDTEKWRKNPFVIFKLVFTLAFVRNAKVVVSCEAMAPKVVKFLYYCRLQKDVIYWVIGCDVVRRIGERELNPKHFAYLKSIVVQSPKMVETLNSVGLRNAIYVPNSKPVYGLPEVEHLEGVTRFVFVARIIPEKGCDLILNCVERLNAEGLGNKFSVDFYGKIGPGYDFESRVSAIGNVSYQSVLNLLDRAGYEEMSHYDVFLFPTYYKGEGFPGSVIDAYIAGLPIIASDWHFNKDVIKDGETGFIIPPQDEEALYKSMLSLIRDKSVLRQMRSNCLQEAKRYDVNNVLNEDVLRKVGLIG